MPIDYCRAAYADKLGLPDDDRCWPVDWAGEPLVCCRRRPHVGPHRACDEWWSGDPRDPCRHAFGAPYLPEPPTR